MDIHWKIKVVPWCLLCMRRGDHRRAITYYYHSVPVSTYRRQFPHWQSSINKLGNAFKNKKISKIVIMYLHTQT
ncbi:hypothetical protein BJ165DRAFT_1478347 [Panaeolus papilionaceus]|nr:hypothetical protein BJ165DRAFT_1478347 [Panaeolus papilionaceus]